jgi:hypothetical protein
MHRGYARVRVGISDGIRTASAERQVKFPKTKENLRPISTFGANVGDLVFVKIVLAVPIGCGILAGSKTVKPRIGMTRNEKIARLPAALREEINRRLDDSQESKTILPSLNVLPKVKAVVDAEFAENLVTKHNLAEWKTGGCAIPGCHHPSGPDQNVGVSRST